MAKPNLRTRLVVSHLLVVLLSMVIVALSGVSINPLLFEAYWISILRLRKS
jgi:hypothetical protein